MIIMTQTYVCVHVHRLQKFYHVWVHVWLFCQLMYVPIHDKIYLEIKQTTNKPKGATL